MWWFFIAKVHLLFFEADKISNLPSDLTKINSRNTNQNCGIGLWKSRKGIKLVLQSWIMISMCLNPTSSCYKFWPRPNKQLHARSPKNVHHVFPQVHYYFSKRPHLILLQKFVPCMSTNHVSYQWHPFHRKTYWNSYEVPQRKWVITEIDRTNENMQLFDQQYELVALVAGWN